MVFPERTSGNAAAFKYKSYRIPAEIFLSEDDIRDIEKKKKFDEIFVGDKNLFNVLDKISFIHRAKVSYY